MKTKSSLFIKCGLFSFFLLAGCITTLNPSVRYAPKPDGNYDNHTYLVDSSQMNIARVMASFVMLYTQTKFENPDGEVLVHQKMGSGVILDSRYVLTVEHVIAQHEYSVVTPYGMMQIPVKRKISEKTTL